jgi:LmbE family N-acetylglucosaminyl deacetylase
LLLDERDRPPQLITDFSDRQIIVLAPHMDDEIAGCGGTLRIHLLSGAQLLVVYMTDGRKGNPDLYRQCLTKKAIAEAEEALMIERRNEAEKAARIVGIQDQIFLDLPDGALDPSSEIVQRLKKILQEKQPTVIYLPFMMELHQDHWATNRVFYEVIKGLSFSRLWMPVFRGYEVWTPLFANRMVDISEVYDIKKKALEQFKSQNARIDYVNALSGLNAYRSIFHLRGRGYAEAFYECTPKESMSAPQKNTLNFIIDSWRNIEGFTDS